MPTNKQVLGFYPSWSTPDINLLRYDLLSTISWFGVGVNSSGGLIPDSGFPPTTLINKAHTNNVKVIFTVDSFDANIMDAVLNNPTNFINNVASYVTNNGFDGVDIDFEGVSATNSISGTSNKDKLNNLFSLLSNKLRTINPNYYIGTDLPAVDWNNVWDVTTIQNYVSYMMIMGYDYHWSSGPTAGSVAPIDSDYIGGPTPSIRNSIEYYGNKSSRSKLLLGVPYYGYEWPTSSNIKESSTTSVGRSITYPETVNKPNLYGRIWDSIWKTPWYTYQQSGQWYQGHYDDTESLGLKYDLVNVAQYAGIGIWALGYDGNLLWNVIEQKFACPNLVCTLSIN